MNYDLALQLKKAGFPQELICGTKYYYHFSPDSKTELLEHCEDHGQPSSIQFLAKVPTLSELIEACGDDFHDLSRWKKGNEKGDWNAIAINLKGNEWGCTPEESVAKLWLALNTK